MSEIGFGFSATEPKSGFVVGTSRRFWSVESAEPDSSLLRRISDLGGVTTPWPLSYSSVTVFFDSAVSAVSFNGRRFNCRRHLDRERERKKTNFDVLKEEIRESFVLCCEREMKRHKISQTAVLTKGRLSGSIRNYC
ncbi:hypothetical protein EUTSA_v10009072mg [Eutrema salsugineum]|uniref:Uncharacterized protein n=1 Tax=Eutrema salsugineum TaxID=72664 RepID=V4L2R2_EUTSA|nr:hypothetical protein EUTSA_v10009072mg [Eutrema salsugineum]